MTNTKTCPYCGEKIVGRLDKIYCDGFCKSNHHYQIRKADTPRYYRIDRQLKRNRKILKSFNPSGKTIVRQSVLMKKGFNPNFFTNYWKNGKGQTYLFCYEFGFLKIFENNIAKYVLVQWQKYMEK